MSSMTKPGLDTEEADDAGEAMEAPAPFEHNGEIHLRPEVIVPTITCDDAAALSTPAAGTVHLICVDPPYYKNVQYAELSNFFYVWLKRALRDCPGLASSRPRAAGRIQPRGRGERGPLAQRGRRRARRLAGSLRRGLPGIAPAEGQGRRGQGSGTRSGSPRQDILYSGGELTRPCWGNIRLTSTQSRTAPRKEPSMRESQRM